jgi:hypothetical protein
MSISTKFDYHNNTIEFKCNVITGKEELLVNNEIIYSKYNWFTTTYKQFFTIIINGYKEECCIQIKTFIIYEKIIIKFIHNDKIIHKELVSLSDNNPKYSLFDIIYILIFTLILLIGSYLNFFNHLATKIYYILVIIVTLVFLSKYIEKYKIKYKKNIEEKIEKELNSLS